MRAAVALSLTSVWAGGGVCEEGTGRVRDEAREICGGVGVVVVARASSEVLLAVGAALGRGSKKEGGRSDACAILLNC